MKKPTITTCEFKLKHKLGMKKKMKKKTHTLEQRKSSKFDYVVIIGMLTNFSTMQVDKVPISFQLEQM